VYSSHFFLYLEQLLQGQAKVSAAGGEFLLKPVQDTPMPDEQVGSSTASVSLKRRSTRKKSGKKSKVSAKKATPARSSHVKVKREPKSSVKPKAHLTQVKKAWAQKMFIGRVWVGAGISLCLAVLLSLPQVRHHLFRFNNVFFLFSKQNIAHNFRSMHTIGFPSTRLSTRNKEDQDGVPVATLPPPAADAPPLPRNFYFEGHKMDLQEWLEGHR